MKKLTDPEIVFVGHMTTKRACGSLFEKWNAERAQQISKQFAFWCCLANIATFHFVRYWVERMEQHGPAGYDTRLYSAKANSFDTVYEQCYSHSLIQLLTVVLVSQLTTLFEKLFPKYCETISFFRLLSRRQEQTRVLCSRVRLWLCFLLFSLVAFCSHFNSISADCHKVRAYCAI